MKITKYDFFMLIIISVALIIAIFNYFFVAHGFGNSLLTLVITLFSFIVPVVVSLDILRFFPGAKKLREQVVDKSVIPILMGAMIGLITMVIIYLSSS